MSRQRNCRETDRKTERASDAYREFAQKEELGTSAHSGSLQAFYIQTTVKSVLTWNGKFIAKLLKCGVRNKNSKTRGDPAGRRCICTLKFQPLTFAWGC